MLTKNILRRAIHPDYATIVGIINFKRVCLAGKLKMK